MGCRGTKLNKNISIKKSNSIYKNSHNQEEFNEKIDDNNKLEQSPAEQENNHFDKTNMDPVSNIEDRKKSIHSNLNNVPNKIHTLNFHALINRSLIENSPLKSWLIKLNKTIELENKTNILIIERIPDLNILILVYENNEISLYKLTESDHHKLLSHESKINCISYLNDGERILSGHEDGKIFVNNISLKSSELLYAFENRRVNKIYLGNEGDNIYILSDERIYSYSLKSLKINNSYVKNEIVSSLAYSYISDLLFLGCNDKIKVYAGSTGQSIKEINSPQQEDENIIITEIISFSINKQTYIACIIKNKISAEELICVYDYASNNYIKTKDLGFTNLKNLIYCNDSKTLIISSSQKENEALILFNFKYGSTKIFSCDGKSINSMIYIGEDDFVIVSGTNDSYLNIFSY